MPRRELKDWLTPLLCGLLLRAWMVHHFALVSGDGLLYGRIAINWLQHGVYGFATAPLRPTLIRLPGYAMFLAAVFKLFGTGNYAAVLRLQSVVDVATCALVALFVRHFASRRAALAALWLGVLCPFTASYVVVPLTETLSIFCVALAMLAAAHCDREDCSRPLWLLLLAFALSYAILLRPDGGLLAAVVIPYLLVRAWQRRSALAMRRLVAVSLLALLPLVPWTLRNYRVFHVFQPLAPRYANDPAEPDEAGYKSWVKTWFVDSASNEEFYWCADDCPLDINLLPSRAFDSPQQREQTAALLNAENNAGVITPQLDAQFAALAHARAGEHPLRAHVLLPMARLADMLLRPRTELFPVPSRWWEFRAHARTSWFALAYAALNLAYLLLAGVGFLRRRVPLAPMLLAYVALRCALLLTVENSEPRYTLEFFPIVFAAAACALFINKTEVAK